MTDGVTITLTFTLKPEFVDGFLTNMPEMLKDTANRTGFRDIRVVRHRDDPNRILIFETWDTEQSYAEYMAWRTERGDFESFGAMLAGAPEVNYWPEVVARKNL
jgi:quinol monooxygenase YgiN